MGFVIAVIAAVVIWWFLFRTTIGFEIRTVGLNPNAARYAGIRVARTVILAMVLSGFLAGMGGAIETQGVVYRYQPGFNVGLGFDGITIALLGRTHPIGVIPAAILVGAMKAGASNMQFSAGVASQITDVIQALILFFVAADVIHPLAVAHPRRRGRKGHPQQRLGQTIAAAFRRTYGINCTAHHPCLEALAESLGVGGWDWPDDRDRHRCQLCQ
jgi:ABC-type uncharacterized transport system permease subunit